MHSCCFHLPAFNVFSPEVNYFKANVDHLDIASQVGSRLGGNECETAG